MSKLPLAMSAIALALAFAYFAASRSSTVPADPAQSTAHVATPAAASDRHAPDIATTQIWTYPRDMSGPLVLVDSHGEPVAAHSGSLRLMQEVPGGDPEERMARISESRWTLRLEHMGALMPTTLAVVVSHEPRKGRRGKCERVAFSSELAEGPTIRAVADDE